MLQTRRIIASLPDGLCDAGEKLTKGRLVARSLKTDKSGYELKLATTNDDVYGFVTLRIDSNEHKMSYYDEIEKGKKAVVYTLVKNEEYGTDQFKGEIGIGDFVSCDTDGTLKKETEKASALFEVVATYPAMGGYEKPMIDVKVL